MDGQARSERIHHRLRTYYPTVCSAVVFGFRGGIQFSYGHLGPCGLRKWLPVPLIQCSDLRGPDWLTGFSARASAAGGRKDLRQILEL